MIYEIFYSLVSFKGVLPVALSSIFDKVSASIPAALEDWNGQVNIWCADYSNKSAGARLTEITIDQGVFIFDLAVERVVLAYSISTKQLCKRDSSRIRGFPKVKFLTQSSHRENIFVSDKGHFLGHACGGELDINLFPQRRELNRGWSEEGKRFRKMEKYVADNTGTFFYHRAIYNDQTWVPSYLEYGVLRDHETWWIDKFKNGGE